MSKPRKHDGVVYAARMARSGGFDTGSKRKVPSRIQSYGGLDEANRKLRERLQARDATF